MRAGSQARLLEGRGVPAYPRGMSPAPRKLRIASYNIWRCRHLDARMPAPGGGSVLDDIARLEPLHAADVIFLQEAVVGRFGAASASRDAVAEIRRGLAANGSGPMSPETYYTAFHGAPLANGLLWGVGLVSRYPADCRALDLPRPFWSPWQRSALLVRLGPWILVTLHLEVWPLVGTWARREQMRTVLAALDAMPGSKESPIVVAGDFNCEPGAGPHRALAARGFEAALEGRRPTFRMAGVGFQLDHIYVRRARVVEAGVGEAARGSDHLPVWATVESDASDAGAEPESR